MKKLSKWIVAFLITTNLQAQSPTNIAADTIISYPLLVSQHMTTNLRFPIPIFRVDIGSAAVIGRKIGKTENILLLKAAKPGFPATNVSVYLDNGQLYSFLVGYADSLTSFNYSYPATPPPSNGVIFTSTEDNKSRMEKDASLLSQEPGFIHLTRSSAQLRLTLTGSYIKDGLIWFTLKASNRSSLPCKPDLIHLAIEDQHQLRRTAIQSIEVAPVYIPQNTPIPADSSISFTLGLKPLTLDKKKILILEWGEKDGRRIRLPITGKKLLQTRPL